MTDLAPVLRIDTITKLPAGTAGAVGICASHGGAYPAYLASKGGFRAVVLCDAGIGLDEAGVRGLTVLEGLGLAAAAVSHLTARIGDAADMLARGRLSRVNALAAALGCAPGQPAAEAAERLRAAPLPRGSAPPYPEARQVIEAPPGGRRLVIIDSASLVQPEDAGQIVVTGSHGGLIGGNPAAALRVEAFAAFYNDAGIGIEEIGVSRLPALEVRGIAAGTVAAASARIGEALSTLQDGVLSRVNPTLHRLGAREGMPLREVVERLRR